MPTTTAPPAFAFGTRVRVVATVTRIIRPGWGSLYWLPDRRDPTRGKQVFGPDDGWPGEPIAGGAPAGYDLEPEAGKGAVRLRRLPAGPEYGLDARRGIVVGSCLRYEGTYHRPDYDYGQPGSDGSPGALVGRRAVRLVEVALDPDPTEPDGAGVRWPVEFALVWHEDLTVEPDLDKLIGEAGTDAFAAPTALTGAG